MKKFLLIIIANCLLFGNVFASNIATVNVEEIIKGSTAFKKLNDSLEKEKKSFEEKIKQKEIEFNAKRDNLQSQSSILSKENLQKQAMEFQNDVMKFQEEVKNKENDLQSRLSYGLNILNEETQKIVNDIVKENGNYKFVLNSNQVLYADSSSDITMEVLKRLNKKKLDLIKKKISK